MYTCVFVMAKAIILIEQDERWDSKQRSEKHCSLDFQGSCYKDIAVSPHLWGKREQPENSGSITQAASSCFGSVDIWQCTYLVN